MFTFYTNLKTESYGFISHQEPSPAKLGVAKPIGTAKGTLGNKEMTLSEVKDWFLTYKNNFNYSGKGTDKEFCLLANGF